MTYTRHPEDVPQFNERQQEVLTVVLDLMVETGDGFSMAAVARRARCSKETIYKWFGDREGLLTATVQWQAAKVRAPGLPEAALSRERYVDVLEQFAMSWLTVITGDISVALNRIAITHATGKGNLGRIVLDNGPFGMARRLKPIFEMGRAAGFLDFEDVQAPFRTFFGLVVADTQICLLLGGARPDVARIDELARRAVAQFLDLYGAEKRLQES